MKIIYTFLACLVFSLSVAGQEITIDQLFEIVNCKQNSEFDFGHCYTKIVKSFDYERLDHDSDEGYTGSSIGARKKVYAPKSTATSKINSISFLVHNPKTFAVIYTDDEDHFNSLHKEISGSENYVRMPEKEGSSSYEDWVYELVGQTKYQVNFIKTSKHEKGNFCISLSKRWY